MTAAGEIARLGIFVRKAQRWAMDFGLTDAQARLYVAIALRGAPEVGRAKAGNLLLCDVLPYHPGAIRRMARRIEDLGGFKVLHTDGKDNVYQFPFVVLEGEKELAPRPPRQRSLSTPRASEGAGSLSTPRASKGSGFDPHPAPLEVEGGCPHPAPYEPPPRASEGAGYPAPSSARSLGVQGTDVGKEGRARPKGVRITDVARARRRREAFEARQATRWAADA